MSLAKIYYSERKRERGSEKESLSVSLPHGRGFSGNSPAWYTGKALASWALHYIRKRVLANKAALNGFQNSPSIEATIVN